ncbi:MAG: hypothetical protein QG614_190 [Patescibacteria group bacterium]|nr:hypothetical protein [Patescibacteria group bacterium]
MKPALLFLLPLVIFGILFGFLLGDLTKKDKEEMGVKID